MVVAAGKFKAQCLRLMDLVNETHEAITITKHGKPVARLVPVSDRKARGIFGFLSGVVASETDIVSPTGESWYAAEDDSGGS